MGYAAAPAWFSENLGLIALGTLVALTVVVLRVVQAVAVRVALLVLLGGIAVFVYLNRAPLEDCAQTCQCRLMGQDITVPACGRELDI